VVKNRSAVLDDGRLAAGKIEQAVPPRSITTIYRRRTKSQQFLLHCNNFFLAAIVFQPAATCCFSRRRLVDFAGGGLSILLPAAWLFNCRVTAFP
jgi:hypothetical protein